MKKIIFLFLTIFFINANVFAIEEVSDELYKKYKKVTQEANLIKAIETLDKTTGKYSKEAILGKNLTNHPIAVEFMNLASINPMYMNFDALGWKKKKNLYKIKKQFRSATTRNSVAKGGY